MSVQIGNDEEQLVFIIVLEDFFKEQLILVCRAAHSCASSLRSLSFILMFICKDSFKVQLIPVLVDEMEARAGNSKTLALLPPMLNGATVINRIRGDDIG